MDFHITDERGKVLGYRNLSELRRRLQPVMLRRDRTLVRDQLPDRIEQRRDVAMTPHQIDIHDEALANAAELVDAATRASPKIDELASILEETCQLAGLKAVVFSQWARMGELVELRIKRMGLGCVRLHGGVPSIKRGDLMDRFRDDETCQIFISTDAGGTGLNLQSASVLVNLDIPWNPAILDQRVARIHRLGQQNKVQVLHLVAPESYEEQVLKLIQGKRNLFDNVVNPDATEDVVGVSKRLAEVLAEDLAATTAEDTAEALPAPAPQLPDETDAAPAPAEPATAIASGRLVAPDPTDPGVAEEVRRCILALQRELGPGIERILGAQGGLLVVMDAVDDAADERAAAVSQQIPIALIDRRTLKGLQRLGAASPANDAKSLYEAPEQSAATQPALAHRARQKLEAAEILLGQDHPAPAGELLLGALLCAATLRCGDTAPPEPRTAGVWLYANALPSGKLQPDDATLIMRAVALAQAEDQTPPDLLAALVADVARFITDTTDCA